MENFYFYIFQTNGEITQIQQINYKIEIEIITLFIVNNNYTLSFNHFTN